MGYSNWDSSASQALNVVRATKPREEVFVETKIHPAMNPYGVMRRESRESAEHPDPVSIITMLDGTGSMSHLPTDFAGSILTRVMSLLVDQGFVADPQMLLSMICDYSDRAVLQVGQFESGLEIDRDLTRLWLASGGGGSGPCEEAYELGLYWAATRPVMDSFERHGKKGYLFVIGDEKPSPSVKKAGVRKIIGDNIDDDIPTELVLKMAQEKFHVFFIHANSGSYGSESGVFKRWQQLLGPNAIRMDNHFDFPELQGVILGLMEGTIASLNDGAARLAANGTKKDVIDRVVAALAPFAASLSGDDVAVVPASPRRRAAATRL